MKPSLTLLFSAICLAPAAFAADCPSNASDHAGAVACASAKAKAAQTALRDTLARTLTAAQKFDALGHTDFAGSLDGIQQAWQGWMQQECALEAGVGHGKTLAEPAGDQCRTRLIDQRVETLDQLRSEVTTGAQ